MIKSRNFQDVDYFVLDNKGFPFVWLEIKVRRQSLTMFADAIFPYRKHVYAARLLAEHGIRCVAAVEYPDALVEVDLTAEPSEVRDILRSDRVKPVTHAIYAMDRLRVLAGEPADAV